ncbi:hypothetical protein OV079_00375 [Nannocystis pusilla]|uniref:Uncharacterized protein n=1 Tax=Nannocystis pusilla TaxID=889268 RepID=A0A9X3IVS5_9BACT|nr:hypothetical protein [Nannocystis pusilla]MCY1004048.1 hypothetical protein [Nannocystis pusilla]
MICLLLAGCVLTPEVVGESLSTDGPVSISSVGTEGSATDITATTEYNESAGTESSVTNISATTLVVETGAIEPEPGEYGGPCELAFDYPIEAKAVTPQPDCDGGICLFMWDQEPPGCTDDSDCAAPWATCGGTHCILDQEVVASESRCTQTCDEDADCPVIPGCAQGPACVPVTRLGELCCVKMCACSDHLSVGEWKSLAQECQEPGSCDP